MSQKKTRTIHCGDWVLQKPQSPKLLCQPKCLMQQHSLPAANDIVAIVPLEVSYTLPMFSMPQEKKCAEPRQRPHNLSLFVNQQGSRLFIYFFVVGVFFFQLHSWQAGCMNWTSVLEACLASYVDCVVDSLELTFSINVCNVIKKL